MLPFDISHNMTELCWEGTKEQKNMIRQDLIFFIAFDQYDWNRSNIANREIGSLWEKCSLKLLWRASFKLGYFFSPLFFWLHAF